MLEKTELFEKNELFEVSARKESKESDEVILSNIKYFNDLDEAKKYAENLSEAVKYDGLNVVIDLVIE